MVRYKLSQQAQDDLDSISDYILEDNPARAVSFVRELIERFEAIADFPSAYGRRDDLPDDLRALAHGNYRIVYRVEIGHPHILRVMHAARDSSDIFG